MVSDRYYYSKLNKRKRQIYSAIYNGIIHYKEYVDLPVVGFVSDTMIGSIYHWVLWDNPYIFTVGEYAMWHALSPDGNRIRMTTLCDKYSEKVCRRELEKAVNAIFSNLTINEMSDFQKEVFVHDFLVNNVEYDNTLGNGGSRLEPYTVYGALVERKAVCEGIAKAAKLLLNMLDVKCIVVDGEYKGHGHAWNVVKISDYAYNLDITFDLGRVVHKGFMRYDYFNFRDSDDANRTKNNKNILPDCYATEGNYVVRIGGYVSDYENLKRYIERALKRRRKCLYFKMKSENSGGYAEKEKAYFREQIDKAFGQVVSKLQINTSRFVDDTGGMGIVSVEVEYI